MYVYYVSKNNIKAEGYLKKLEGMKTKFEGETVNCEVLESAEVKDFMEKCIDDSDDQNKKEFKRVFK